MFLLTARGRSSAGSHPRKSRSSSCYLAGGTALALAGTHSIHRTTVLSLLERHHVSRRGRVLTPDHIRRAVSLFTPRDALVPRSAEELQFNPETVRQALLKARRGHAQARASTTTAGVLSPLDWRYERFLGPWKHSPTRPPPGHSSAGQEL